MTAGAWDSTGHIMNIDNISPREVVLKKPNALLPFLSALISALIVVASLDRIGVFPFGNLTLLMSDLDSIYGEYLAELQRVLQGKADPFYSFHAGLGLNTFAIYVFYLSSPFHFLLKLIPENYLIDGITLITILKIASAAWTMTFFLQRHRPGVPRNFWSFILGLTYSLSGYVLSYSFSLIWLDAVVFLPLTTAAIDALFRRKPTVLLIFAFGILFFSSFYTGYMAGICAGLYFLAKLITRESANTGQPSAASLIFKFTISVLIAAALNMAFILPTAYVLANNMGLFGQSAPEFRVLFELFDLPWKLFNGSLDGFKDSLPFIYSGLLPLVSIPFFFRAETVSTKKKLAAASLLGIVVLGFHLSPLNFIWHAFDHPSWFPFRYAFVFPFLLIWIAFAGMGSALDEPSTPRTTALVPWIAVLIGYLSVVWKFDPTRVDAAFFYRNTALILTIAFAATRIRCYPRQDGWKFTLTLLVILDLSLNAFATLERYRDAGYYTPRSELKAFREENALPLAELRAKDGNFYRIEKSGIRTHNDNISLGLPGIGQFSSVSSIAQTKLLKDLGYDCYATWCYYRSENPFADSLLSIKYVLNGRKTSPYASVQLNARENQDAFPLAFYVDTENIDLKMDQDEPTVFHQRFADALFPDSESLYEPITVPAGTPVNLRRTEGQAQESAAPRWEKIDKETDASMTIRWSAKKAGVYVLYLPSVSRNYNVLIDGNLIYTDHGSYSPFLTSFRTEANEAHTIEFSISKDEDYYDDVRIYRLNEKALSGIAETLRLNAPSFRFDGRRTFTFSLSPAAQTRSLLTSIPFDAGWRANLSGTQLETASFSGGLLTITIPPNKSGTLTLTFEPPLLWLGSVISFSALILTLLAAIISTVQFWIQRRKAARVSLLLTEEPQERYSVP